MLPIARYLKTHASGDTGTNYTPVFTDGSFRNSPTGSVGSWTPNWFGIHNPSGTGQAVTVWTVDQGTAGTGGVAYLSAGGTFYTNIAKVQSTSNVTLLGTTNTIGLV